MNRYNFNPCDLDRFRGLVVVGDALAWLYQTFTRGTDCVCCLGMRLTLLTALSFTLGGALF